MIWWIFLVCGALLLLLWYSKRSHWPHSHPSLRNRLDGKLVIVTGCNTGIGLEVVGELARRGARVVMACRNMEKSYAARSELLQRYGDKVLLRSDDHGGVHLTPIEEDQLICEHLDVGSTKSIRAFATRMLHQETCVHILINNAGVLFDQLVIDDDGIEEHMRVNHLGHFMLTNLLLPLLQAAQFGRVINVSSVMHRLSKLNPNDLTRPIFGSAYAASKLANVMHAHELSVRYPKDVIFGVSVHPGWVRTDIFRGRSFLRWFTYYAFRLFTRSSNEGAQTIVFCALDEHLTPGGYYVDFKLRDPNAQASDSKLCSIVWETSEELIRQWEAGSRA